MEPPPFPPSARAGIVVSGITMTAAGRAINATPAIACAVRRRSDRPAAEGFARIGQLRAVRAETASVEFTAGQMDMERERNMMDPVGPRPEADNSFTGNISP
jgi:hypothetical protein